MLDDLHGINAETIDDREVERLLQVTNLGEPDHEDVIYGSLRFAVMNKLAGIKNLKDALSSPEERFKRRTQSDFKTDPDVYETRELALKKLFQWLFSGEDKIDNVASFLFTLLVEVDDGEPAPVDPAPIQDYLAFVFELIRDNTNEKELSEIEEKVIRTEDVSEDEDEDFYTFPLSTTAYLSRYLFLRKP